MIKLRNLLHGLLTLFLMAGCMLLFACKSQPAVLDAPQKTKGANTQTLPPSPSPTPEISYQGPVSRVEGKTFLVRTKDGTFSPFFVKGVDIGAAKPGFWPGEFGIPESDYLRWFQQIGEMYANTIRVYVPQMPEFYQALLTYNRTASQPLYLLQGIYMNESLIETYLDAFNPDLNEIFQRDLKNTIDIIHGHAIVEKLPGNAGGTYTADVSQYVIGYQIGRASCRERV